jgi:hypothetical protein
MGGSSNNDKPITTGDPKPTCPLRVIVTMPNPGGLSTGDQLELLLEGTNQPVLVLATTKGVRVGPVAGVPELSKLIQCLKDQVPYTARVENLTPGLLTCVIARQWE